MNEKFNFNNKISQETETNKIENTQNRVEQEISQEVDKLESNIDELQKDIEEAGGPEKLAELLEEKENLASTKLNDRYNKKLYLILSIAMGSASTFLSGMSAYIEPQLNRLIEEDADMGNLITGTALLGVFGTILLISKYIKYKKRLNRGEELKDIA